MAQQDGIIRLTGSLGGLSFYRDKRTGYQVRTKGGFYGKPVESAPEYERTRENSTEFANAVRSAKLLRTALHSLLMHTADNRLVNRLNAQMVKIVKSDTHHDRGKRTVAHGTCERLKGFEFNAQASFMGSVREVNVMYTENAELHIQIHPANIPARHPQGATHYRIGSLVAAVDFVTRTAKTYPPVTPVEIVSLSALAVSPTPRIHHINSGEATHVIVALNIEFFQQSNNTLLPLQDAQYQAGMIAEVYSTLNFES